MEKQKRGWPSLDGISASLLSGRPWAQTAAGPALRVLNNLQKVSAAL